MKAAAAAAAASAADGLPAQLTAADAASGGDVPDLTGFRVAYRAMRAEVGRLAEAAGRIASGEQTCRTRRAAAVAGYVEATCAGIRQHHFVEQTALWPVLRAAGAGAGDGVGGVGVGVDLPALTVQQREMEPLFDSAVEAAGTLHPKDTASARRLAEALDALRAALIVHLDAKESAVFPAVLARVSAADWRGVVAAARKAGNVREDLPRVAAYASGDELARVIADAGRGAGLVLTFLLPTFRRRQRLVLGTPSPELSAGDRG